MTIELPRERTVGYRSQIDSGIPRVAIVARYPAQRAELYAMLDRVGAVEIAASAAGAAELSDVLDVSRPHTIVFDDEPHDRLRLFDFALATGFAVVLIGNLDDASSLAAGSTGNGWGIVLRDVTPKELTAAVMSASAGLDVFDPRVSTALSRREHSPLRLGGTTGFGSDQDEQGAPLSPREKEVLELISRGMPNKQIAARLGISSHTVKFHIGSLLVKLGAASRAEAVTLGARRGELLL